MIDSVGFFGPTKYHLSVFLKVVLEILGLCIHVSFIYLECFLSSLFGRTEKNVVGKVVAITGGGQGFGKELALIFAKRGASVALLDINVKGVQEVGREIKELLPTTKFIALRCDVTNLEDVIRVFGEIKDSLGPVDILINNAGIVSCKPFLELDPKSIERTFQVNSIAHFWTTRVVLPDMMSRGNGHIVAISSSAGLTGTANLTDYCASKFATIGFMKSLELELHSKSNCYHDIELTTVCPLAMSTGMFHAPKSRFPFIFGTIDPRDAAEKAVHGILTHERLVCIPKRFEYFHRISQVTPSKVSSLVQLFFEYGVEPHQSFPLEKPVHVSLTSSRAI
jgi:all-trans-retinol dehydrogenase (NAD+)